jgi:hypothetical protein
MGLKMAAYWIQRDAAKAELEISLRNHLLKRFLGKPVIELRRKIDEIKIANKEFVSNLLKEFGVSDYPVKWGVFFTYVENDGNLPIVSNFTVMAE